MPRKEKFEEYGLKTKPTTIRIPDLEDLDKEKKLRKAIDIFVLDSINLKANTNMIDVSIIKKFIPPFIKNEMDIPFNDEQQIRLKEIWSEIKNG